jgi:hypothetical protein
MGWYVRELGPSAFHHSQPLKRPGSGRKRYPCFYRTARITTPYLHIISVVRNRLIRQICHIEVVTEGVAAQALPQAAAVQTLEAEELTEVVDPIEEVAVGLVVFGLGAGNVPFCQVLGVTLISFPVYSRLGDPPV